MSRSIALPISFEHLAAKKIRRGCWMHALSRCVLLLVSGILSADGVRVVKVATAPTTNESKAIRQQETRFDNTTRAKRLENLSYATFEAWSMNLTESLQHKGAVLLDRVVQAQPAWRSHLVEALLAGTALTLCCLLLSARASVGGNPAPDAASLMCSTTSSEAMLVTGTISQAVMMSDTRFHEVQSYKGADSTDSTKAVSAETMARRSRAAILERLEQPNDEEYDGMSSLQVPMQTRLGDSVQSMKTVVTITGREAKVKDISKGAGSELKEKLMKQHRSSRTPALDAGALSQVKE